jgi:membrane protein
VTANGSDAGGAPGAGPRLSGWARARRAGFVAITAEPRFLLLPPRPGLVGRALGLAQGAVLAFRCYRHHHGADRAGALAFQTILTFLPIVLLALSAFGAWGVPEDQMHKVREWILTHFQADAAPGLENLVEDSLESLRKASKALGIAGFVAMILVASRLMATMDRTFEAIWGACGMRSSLRRLGGFWITLVLAPFGVVASLLLTGLLEALASSEVPTLRLVGRSLGVFAPLVPGWFALYLVYTFLPGCSVRARAAAGGALAAAVSWEVLKVLFALYCKHAFLTRTVLAGMGVIPIFLLWLYLSWSVFLIGAEAVLVIDDYGAALRRTGVVHPDAPDPAVTAPAAPGGPPPGP